MATRPLQRRTHQKYTMAMSLRSVRRKGRVFELQQRHDLLWSTNSLPKLLLKRTTRNQTGDGYRVIDTFKQFKHKPCPLNWQAPTHSIETLQLQPSLHLSAPRNYLFVAKSLLFQQIIHVNQLLFHACSTNHRFSIFNIVLLIEASYSKMRILR